jgi:hypothetical protein
MIFKLFFRPAAWGTGESTTAATAVPAGKLNYERTFNEDDTRNLKGQAGLFGDLSERCVWEPLQRR